MIAWKNPIAACLLLAGLLCPCLSASAAVETARSEPTLIVDAGHGGEDGGAVSLTGVPESRFNLDIARRVDQLCGLYAVPVVMLRQEDVSLADPSAQTIREKKRSDLQNRAALVKGRENALLLSIHQNYFEGKQPHGAQVFYRDNERSQRWAQALQSGLRESVDPSNERTAVPVPDFVYLMKHVSCPAVLVECGFLSNPEEEALLGSAAYQKKLAAVLTVCTLEQLRGDG